MPHLQGIQQTKKHPPRLLLVGIVFAVLIGYWLASLVAWQTQLAHAKQQLEQVVSLRTQLQNGTTEQQRMQAIHQLAVLRSSPDSCQGSWWYGWRANADRSKPARAECREQAQTVARASKAAARLEAYLKNDAEVAALISRLHIDTSKKDWQTTARSTAADVDTRIRAVSVSPYAKPLKADAQKRIDAIKKAWDALAAADKAHEVDAYDAAVIRLQTAYADLGAINDRSDAMVQTLVTSVLQDK